MPCSSVLYCIVLHSTAMYFTALHWHWVVLYSAAQHCTKLNCTVLFCPVLHCCVLYFGACSECAATAGRNLFQFSTFADTPREFHNPGWDCPLAPCLRDPLPAPFGHNVPCKPPLQVLCLVTPQHFACIYSDSHITQA